MLNGIARVVFALCAGLLAIAAQAQQVVVVSSHASAPYQTTVSALRATLRDTGVTVVAVPLEGLHKALAEARIFRTDFYVALGARAAQAVTALVPPSRAMSCLTLSDAGLPGVLLAHTGAQRLEVLARLLPSARAIGVLYSPAANPKELAALEAAARSANRRIIARPVADAQDLDAQLDRMANEVDVLLATYDLQIYSPQNAARLIQFSYRHRIPLVGMGDAWSKAGALIGVDWDFADIGAQCGAVAHRLMAGERMEPAQQPPRRLTYSINAATARLLHLELPREAVKGARFVFR